MNRHTYYILAAFIFLLIGCKEPADIDPFLQNPRLVVISNFTPGVPFNVRVSATDFVLEEDEKQLLDDAIVEIWTTGSLLETLPLDTIFPDSGAFYESIITRPVSGATYEIVVSHPDFIPATASDQVPYPLRIEISEMSNLSISPNPIDPNFNLYNFDISITFPDDPGQDDWFHIFTFLRENNGRLSAPPVIVDENNPSLLLNYDNLTILVEDEFAERDTVNLSYTCNFNAPVGIQFDEIIFQVRHVSRSYYLYYESITKQRNTSGDPFAEPVLIFNNIDNGHGNFSGYASDLDTIDFN